MDNGVAGKNAAERLYRRFLDGEETAFDSILHAYRDSLTMFINRYVRDYAAAEDLSIDVFVELLMHPHRYNFKTPLKTYLFMIGRSRALDFLKHRHKIHMTELSEAEAVVSENDLPEEQILRNERARVVHEALKQLPDEMANAVYLVYFENLSYDETAKIMKKNRKQVDNLLYRAKKELREILGEEGRELL